MRKTRSFITHECFIFLSLSSYLYRSASRILSLPVCVCYTRDWTVKKKISMIVCDKFDEDFACVVRFRSQIDLLTDEISHSSVILLNFYLGTISIYLSCI